LDRLVQIYGDSANNPAGYLRIGGFAMQVCRSHAVRMRTAQHCTIAKCAITNTGYTGVAVEGSCSDVRVVGNDIAYIGTGGIVHHGRDSVISNNHLHDTGVIRNNFNRAIEVGGRANIVCHNLIHDVPAWGISFGGHDNIFEYNEIHHTGLEGLPGAIYAIDRGTGWPNPAPNDPPAISGTIIRFNKFTDAVGYGMSAPGEWGPNPGFGIWLDDYVSTTTIYGNILVRDQKGGIIIHGGNENIVENNIMGAGIPSTLNHIKPGDEVCNNRILRNIVYYPNADPHLLRHYGYTVKTVTETSSSSAAIPVFLCGWSSVQAAVAQSDYNLFFPIRGADVRALLTFRGVGEAFFGPWADAPVEDRFAWWQTFCKFNNSG